MRVMARQVVRVRVKVRIPVRIRVMCFVVTRRHNGVLHVRQLVSGLGLGSRSGLNALSKPGD